MTLEEHYELMREIDWKEIYYQVQRKELEDTKKRLARQD